MPNEDKMYMKWENGKDAYAYFFPTDSDMKPKKTRAKSEEKPDKPAEPVKMIESFYGGMFPDEPGMWFNMPPFSKKVHMNEHGRFNSEYGLCIIKNIYCRLEKLGSTIDGRLISKSLAAENGWVLCQYFEQYCKLEDTVEITTKTKGGIITTIRVSRRAYERHYRKCDWSGLMYDTSRMVSITASLKYRTVSREYIDGHFLGCPGCGETFEFEMVKKRPDLANVLLCKKCYRSRVNDGLILKHDAKDYPDPIRTVSTRLGHVVRGGKIWATMKPEEVIDTRIYGVEVETELSLKLALEADLSRFEIARAIYDGMGRDFVMIKEDGTLIVNGKYNDAMSKYGTSHAGFEIVSAAASLEEHRRRWPAFGDLAVHKLLRSWDYDTCGFHIHVSKESLQSPLIIGRMLVFLNAIENRKFIWKVAGRSEIAYAKYEERKLSDALHPERVINKAADGDHNRGRRVALNVRNEKTVEIRIFRGTVNPRHIIRNIEFYDSVIEFCMPASRSFGELRDYKRYIDFVDHNRKRWPLLAAWFAFHDLIRLKKIKRPSKADKSRFTLRVDDVPESDLLAV